MTTIWLVLRFSVVSSRAVGSVGAWKTILSVSALGVDMSTVIVRYPYRRIGSLTRVYSPQVSGALPSTSPRGRVVACPPLPDTTYGIWRPAVSRVKRWYRWACPDRTASGQSPAALH